MKLNDYQTFIHKSRYSKWDASSGKREDWPETVNRYLDYFNEDLSPEERHELFTAIVNLEVMPSMRCLMVAGEALARSNVAGFNCSAVAANDVRVFDEALFVLMNGTGLGFSCERQYITDLPSIKKEDPSVESIRKATTDPTIIEAINKLDNTSLRRYYEVSEYWGTDPAELSVLYNNVIYVADSKEGWASALRILIIECYNCNWDVEWDVSKVRAAGVKLKVFGGRASGPGPLVDLFKYVKTLFKSAEGRKLQSIEVHKLMCKIAEIVVVGGVRRAALISLSNLSDQRMARCKSGAWWEDAPELALANNSVAYTEKPDMPSFMQEWQNLYNSKSGERGIFNRQAANLAATRSGRRESSEDYLCNPCSEINLLPSEFCNLSEVVAREKDTAADLSRKVELATILGTLQSTMTSFHYLNPTWKQNTEGEALLGVSLTGIMDNPLLNSDTPELKQLLADLTEVAIKTNKEWALKLGVNQSAAITCVKPSGTVSQLVDSASGIHARYSDYYIRTVRQDIKDPITEFLKDQGVPNEPCAMKPDSTVIFSFPMKAPESAVMRNDRNAIEQLDHWLLYQRHWCEHKPSVTVYVKEDEWFDVGAWVYRHFDEVSGVSFLPHSDHTYAQAPYQEISKDDYQRLSKEFPKIDWSKLIEYEKSDNTTGIQELACTAGGCDIL